MFATEWNRVSDASSLNCFSHHAPPPPLSPESRDSKIKIVRDKKKKMMLGRKGIERGRVVGLEREGLGAHHHLFPVAACEWRRRRRRRRRTEQSFVARLRLRYARRVLGFCDTRASGRIVGLKYSRRVRAGLRACGPAGESRVAKGARRSSPLEDIIGSFTAANYRD